jgi:uncharacterized protein (DUF608 family)
MTFSRRPVAAHRWIALPVTALWLVSAREASAQSWQGWWPSQQQNNQPQYRQPQQQPRQRATPAPRSDNPERTPAPAQRSEPRPAAQQRTPKPQASPGAKLTEPQVAIASPAGQGVEFLGQITVHGASGKIAGAPSEETAQLLSNSRSGTDFHVLVNGMPNELLEIELGFAELTNMQPGQRVFDVDINDKRALNNFDIVETAGGINRSLIRRFTITPKRAVLDFHFTSTVGEAQVNYIRVRGRSFVKTIAAQGESSAASALAADDPDSLPTNLPTYNLDTGEVLQDEMTPTWQNGFPLGGIGAGKLEILPNGEFANLTINNSWDLPVGRVPGTFIAVGTKASSGNGVGKILRVKSTNSTAGNYANAKTFLSCVFKGIFPVAQWAFKDDKIPLEVTVEGWSPLVPQNVGDSSLPAAVLYVHLRNPRSFPISAGVALSWEDVNGRGGSRTQGDQYGYAGQAVFSDAATSSVQGVLIRSLAPAEGRRGTFIGDYFIGTPVKRAVVTRQLYWDPRAAEIPWWRSFINRMRLERVGPAPTSVSPGSGAIRGGGRGPGAAVICTTVNLAPKERRRIPFIISWYVPKITTIQSADVPGSTEQQDYATTFGSSLGVASYIASNRARLQENTTDWQAMVLRSNLPMWLKTQVLNSISTIVSNSILLQGSRFSSLESPGEMGGMMGALDLRMAAQPFLTSMYPSLDRSELELYGRAQTESGHLPRYVGNIHGGWTGLDPKLLGQNWSDSSAAWLIQCASHLKATGDQAFAQRIRPAVDKAVKYLEQQGAGADAAQGSSFFDEVSPSGSDIAFTRVNQADALSAAGALYTSLGDATASDGAQKATVQARKVAGEILGTYGNANSTSGTFAAALAGEWASQAGALQPMLDEAGTSKVIAAIISRHLQPYKPAAPLEVNPDGSLVRGLPGYAGLLQPFLGAATILAGDVEAGLDVFSRAQQVACRAQFSPWKQALSETVPEGMKPRMRSHMSSPGAWSALPALAGVALDVPAKRLYLDPKVPASVSDHEVTMPVFTPAFWAWLDYNADDSTGTLAITKVMPGYENFEIGEVAQRLGSDGKAVNLQSLAPKLAMQEGLLIRLDGWPHKSNGKVAVENPALKLDDTNTTGMLSNDDDTTTALSSRDVQTSDTTTSETTYGP